MGLQAPGGGRAASLKSQEWSMVALAVEDGVKGLGGPGARA